MIHQACLVLVLFVYWLPNSSFNRCSLRSSVVWLFSILSFVFLVSRFIHPSSCCLSTVFVRSIFCVACVLWQKIPNWLIAGEDMAEGKSLTAIKHTPPRSVSFLTKIRVAKIRNFESGNGNLLTVSLKKKAYFIRQSANSVLWIRDILVRIRLLGFVPLVTFKMPTKNLFSKFFAFYFLKVHLHHSS